MGSGVSLVTMGEALGDERGLPTAQLGEWRIQAALESALGDPRGLPVTHQDERGSEVRPRLELVDGYWVRWISHRSRTASLARIRSATSSGTRVVQREDHQRVGAR